MVNIICSMRVREQNTMSMQTEFMFPGHHLDPFTLAENNPYSYHAGGFMPGAGHGSTMWDLSGNLWHTSTMRISVNHQFERRVGIWRAGFDADGELFCNQRYGDWPVAVSEKKTDAWENPQWYLLSYKNR